MTARLHRVPGVEEVVGCEILNQVTDQALNQQRGDDRDGNMFGWILRFASHGGHRFESDQNQDRDRCLNEHPVQVMRCHHRQR